MRRKSNKKVKSTLKKRGKTGSLQTKKTKSGKEFYYMVLTLDDNKKKWIATGLDIKNNKKRAEAMLRETLNEYERKLLIPSCHILFSDWIRRWLIEKKKHIDVITSESYENVSKTTILPYFDANRLTLSDISLEVLQTYFDEKATRGRRDGKGGLAEKRDKAIYE